MADTTTNGKSVSSNSQGYIFLYIFIAILLLAGVIFIFKSSLFEKRSVDARILKDEMFLNEDLVFTDNTRNAKKWLWEFGNGAKATTQNGSYHYLKSGSYIIRLTVDGELREQFPVTVRDTVTNAVDTMVTISGPTSGIVNEQVRVEAEGKANSFEWSFGETNRVDVKGRTALYTFHTAGKYMVKLTTDRSRRPIYHTIFITDPDSEFETDIVVPGEGERKVIDDIRARLQAIANGADFNSNYYYLIRKYMCNNEKVTVNVDQDGVKKASDFYSYAMGLTFGGEIMVDEAQLTISPNSTCATLVNIKQHSAKTVKN
ncbi:PKD domain-containing protein [Pedobacter sp. MR2016-24]|uniref:PKD domain-containing protein n=1 Tax=Pedobacter sp. MR2016-24 TaxID=2994466 RepID=UPI002246C644|nr:PKD domain-containing protein [Pedobacter sp. MR2016-24]MCX2484472.1 PKD domain-containing protein [Pedobacter sp. MR2016-24]